MPIDPAPDPVPVEPITLYPLPVERVERRQVGIRRQGSSIIEVVAEPLELNQLIFPFISSFFTSSVLGVWTFDSTLEDLSSQNDFSIFAGSIAYKNFEKYELLYNRIVNRFGLLLEKDIYYTSTLSTGFATNFTLAFWYYSPDVVGFTRHAVTRELEPKLSPIIAKANSQISSTNTTVSESSFIVTEMGHSKTQNAIKVFLTEDGSNVSHVITSEPFTPGLHHVLMTYLNSQGRFRIDIDGKLGILHPAPITSLTNSGPLVINNIVPGYTAHKTNQEGAYIFDLVFTSYGSTENEALKAYRYGYEHITYDDLFDTKFSYFGMSYAQPSTVSTTQIFVEGGNILATRSNGEIVRGSQPVWDKDFTYANTDDVRSLNISEQDVIEDEVKDNDRIAAWTPSGLKVQGVSVKI